MKFLTQEIDKVKVSSLEEFPDNPNEGAQSALESSMERLGYYGALVVQKSTRRILAGNHRWAILMKESPGAEIPVIWLDVSDEEALAILVGDNHINRLGKDNNELLLKALKQIENDLNLLEATGYNEESIQALVDSVTPKRDAPTDEPTGKQREPGNPVVQYQIVFDSEEDQQTWYSFVRWLKKTVEGETLSERLTKFIAQIVTDEDEDEED